MSGRVEAWEPIGSYAALDDGRTVVLVAGDGRVAWWPLPVLNLSGVCGAASPLANWGRRTRPSSGTFGGLFDAVWRYVKAGHVLDTPTGL